MVEIAQAPVAPSPFLEEIDLDVVLATLKIEPSPGFEKLAPLSLSSMTNRVSMAVTEGM